MSAAAPTASIPTTQPRRGLVLDRDGTIIVHVPYLCDPAGVVLLPGVREALLAARAAGVDLFVHSNQSGVGRGMFDLAAVDACNRRMIELLDMGEQPFVRICVAPEAPKDPAVYRKPEPRFAQELLRDFGYAPHHLAYIGDRGSDLETAARAGIGGLGVATGLDDLPAELAELGLDKTFPVFASLSEAVEHFLKNSAMNTPLVLTFEEMLRFRQKAAAEGRRVVLTNGCFDLLHRGHIEYLHQSAALGDLLIIAVNSDASVRALKGPDRPLNSEQDRAYALASLRCVAATFVFPGSRLDQEIRLLKPDIYTKAGDYTIDSLDAGERDALLSVGADIRLMPFVPGRSTTRLVERMRAPC